MTFSFRSLLPTRISSQLAAIVLISLVAIHTILTAAFILRPAEDRRLRFERPEQIATLAGLMNVASPGARAALLADVGQVFPALDARVEPAGTVPLEERERDSRIGIVKRHLPPGLRPALAPPSGGDRHSRIAVRLSDGAVVTARFPPPPGWRPDPFTATVLFIAISLTLLGWWAARTLIAPLRAFAKAAESFRPDGEIVLLPERGPDEIRSVARALNGMRARIKTLVEDRTRMMAAVGHDLRTPITRLRLRSEFIEDATFRGQTLADLNQMQAMVESLLVFLRGGNSPKETSSVDLAAIALTICDQFTDMGHEASYEGPDHVTLRGNSDELERAITNVVDNAVRYGGKAMIHLEVTADTAILDIDDEGPGIPDGGAKESMLQPFVRGEAARSMDATSGFGLGLAITRVIAERHGGTLTLLDRAPRGLRVRIALPISEA
jgi:signal transduction histidine kinase